MISTHYLHIPSLTFERVSSSSPGQFLFASSPSLPADAATCGPGEMVSSDDSFPFPLSLSIITHDLIN